MKYILTNANLYDGLKDSEIVHTNIVIEEDIIKDITNDISSYDTSYQIIDLNNKYVMPGLINLHAHLFGTGKPSKVLGGGKMQKKVIKFCSTKLGDKILMKMVKSHVGDIIKSGVTTLRSSGDFYYSDCRVRDLVNQGKVLGPRLITPGFAITVSNGHGAGTFALTGDSKEELEKLVLEHKDLNVDYIKICVTGGVMDAKKKGEPGVLKMSLEQTKAVCDEAHKHGYKVASHTESPEGVDVAIKAGVDTIEHGSHINDELIDIYKSNGSANVLTLSPALPLAKFDPSITMLNELCVYNSEVILEGMIAGAKKCLENNIPVGLGTDSSCPFVTQYDFWREVCYFTKYIGVSNKFALHTATYINASILRMQDKIGSVEKNKIADLIVLDNNPIEDLLTLKNPNMVISNGKILKDIKIKKNKFMDEKLDTLL